MFNLVQQMVLIQLDWHIFIPTALDLLTPLICVLQATPAWAYAPDRLPSVPSDWVEAHEYLWKKSCEYVSLILPGKSQPTARWSSFSMDISHTLITCAQYAIMQ